MIDQAIYDLIAYAVRTGLIEAEDETWCANALLERSMCTGDVTGLRKHEAHGKDR